MVFIPPPHDQNGTAASSSKDISHWVDYQIRIRYAETDQMGVVYYSNYLIWFEIGRSEYCRKQGFSYAEMEAQTESFLAVAEVSCRYHAPAHYDELVKIRTSIASLKKRALRFQYQILNKQNGILIATGSTTHVILNKNGSPKTLPEKYALLLRNPLSKNTGPRRHPWESRPDDPII